MNIFAAVASYEYLINDAKRFKPGELSQSRAPVFHRIFRFLARERKPKQQQQQQQKRVRPGNEASCACMWCMVQNSHRERIVRAIFKSKKKNSGNSRVIALLNSVAENTRGVNDQ